PVNRWTQSNHMGAYYVLLSDLSVRTQNLLNVVDGFVGYKVGQTIELGIDLRDRKGSQPEFPVAIHVSIEGGEGGYVRRVGTKYRCKEMTFFWSGPGGAAHGPFPLNEIEYTIGSGARVAGMIPAQEHSMGIGPLWAITEHLKIVFGETESARDQ